MILLFINNEKAYVSSAEELLSLRRYYCIVGTMIGGFTVDQKYLMSTFPNQLNSSVVSLSLRKAWTRIINSKKQVCKRFKKKNCVNRIDVIRTEVIKTR